MPTQNVNLTDHQADFIRESVESGDYNSASEVVREALRLLKAHKMEQQAKLERLRAEIQKGVESHETGAFIELNSPAEIADYFEGVKQRGKENLVKELNAPFSSTD